MQTIDQLLDFQSALQYLMHVCRKHNLPAPTGILFKTDTDILELKRSVSSNISTVAIKDLLKKEENTFEFNGLKFLSENQK